tara:strand:- start:358 stop:1380 length:1023 start_codon:yes stop_codon:yes gene_type:complete
MPEESYDLFQTRAVDDPYAGRDPSLYGTVEFPSANFITMIKTGELTFDPEDTMHQKALADYEEEYEAASTADKESMITPEEIAGLSGAYAGAAVGALVGSRFKDWKNPTAERYAIKEANKETIRLKEGLDPTEKKARIDQIDTDYAAANPTIYDSFFSTEGLGQSLGAGVGTFVADLAIGKDPLKALGRGAAVGVASHFTKSLFKSFGARGGGWGALAAGGLVEAFTRVICNELLRQGLMTRRQVLLDYKFTDEHLSEQHVRGYHFWAIGVVKRMRKGKGVGFWRHIATHRANEIEYIYGKKENPDYLGKIYRRIFEPTCWLIGAFCQQKDHTVLYGERS